VDRGQSGSGFETFDELYESCPTFEAVYRSIVEELLAAAESHGRVAYVVPGSPTVAERTVEMLLALPDEPAGPEVVVHPAMSFADLAWTRLGVDPVAVGARLADGHDFSSALAGGAPVLVAQCESRLTLSEIKLSLDEPPDAPVTLLQRLGLPDESIREVPWNDIDRTVEPDHLTSLWIPELPRSAGKRLEELALLMELLRAADPWKAAQDHDTLRRYLLEESYEVLEALDGYDPDTGEGSRELASELGDLLYQVVFHSSLAAGSGWFDLADVVGAIHDKLLSRHRHVDSSGNAMAEGIGSIDELTAQWENAKLAEHGRSSAFDGIPSALPALVRAMVIAKKASALGLVIEEPAEGPGGSLLAVALDAIADGVDPEDALRRELDRVEGILRADGQ
jgi:tetrapyrrole methylase family protein/MazG family protein